MSYIVKLFDGSGEAWLIERQSDKTIRFSFNKQHAKPFETQEAATTVAQNFPDFITYEVIEIKD